MVSVFLRWALWLPRMPLPGSSGSTRNMGEMGRALPPPQLSLPLLGESCLHCAKHPWQELLWEPDFHWQKHFTSLNPTFLRPPVPTSVSLKSQTATSFCLALELPEDGENAAGEPLNERFHASIITLFSQPLHKIAK